MKKILYLLTTVLVVMQASAAVVDVVTAQNSAQRFSHECAATGRHMARS